MIRKKSMRYFIVRGLANFVCRNTTFHPVPIGQNTDRNRTWRSIYAWCIIDLKVADIIHRYTQDCCVCDEIFEPDDPTKRKEPNFGKKSKKSVEMMAEYTVECYKRRQDPGYNVSHLTP